MGRIQELKDKKSKGELSDEEQKELDELLTEAKADEPTPVVPPAPVEPPTDEDEQKAIDDMADEIATKSVERVSASIKPLVDQLESYKPKAGDIVNEAKFIVDKDMGKVGIEKLSEVKVKLEGREGKQVKEVSKLTTHWLAAMLTGNKEKLQLLVEGTAALGGNLVPQEFANLIVEDRRDAVVMRQLATVIQMSGDTLNLPTLDSRPHVAWRSEGAVKATSTAQFGNLTLTPYSLAGIVGLSNELVADASQGVGASIVTYVAKLLTQAIAEEEEVQFWTGNGSGKPTGIDNYSFTTVSGGLTDTTRADAFKAAYFRLPQGYRNSAVFAMNASTMARAAQLKESNTNAYLLQRLGDSPIPQIMGRPVYEVPALGDGKAFFGDFSFYYIGEREGVAVDTSEEATVAGSSAFEKNLTFVRVEERVDGELASTRAVVEMSSLGGAF